MDFVGLMVVLAPLLILGSILIMGRRRAGYTDSLAEVCARHVGLRLEAGGAVKRSVASGQVDGVPVEITSVDRGTSDTADEHTLVAVRVPMTLGPKGEAALRAAERAGYRAKLKAGRLELTARGYAKHGAIEAMLAAGLAVARADREGP